MARKKKKLSRKQLKQQRQEAVARKRKEQGWQPREYARTKRAQDEVIEDMRPLLMDTSTSDEALLNIFIDSWHLAEEPEFEEIVIDPMLCVMTFIEAAEELGIGPTSLDTLSDEDVDEEAQIEMMQITVRRLLTKQVRAEIIDGLNDLRLRLKQSGTVMEVARVAALQSFLREHNDLETWSVIGLVQAIVGRGLEAGLALFELSMEAEDPEDRRIDL